MAVHDNLEHKRRYETIESDEALNKIRNILNAVMKHKHSWPFNSPVDAKGLNLHDYFEIVRHPMDLTVLMERRATNNTEKFEIQLNSCPRANHSKLKPKTSVLNSNRNKQQNKHKDGNIIDGENEIIQNPNESQRKEMKKYEFETNEVYAIDVLISTGEGQGREKMGKTPFATEKHRKLTLLKKQDYLNQQ